MSLMWKLRKVRLTFSEGNYAELIRKILYDIFLRKLDMNAKYLYLRRKFRAFTASHTCVKPLTGGGGA